MHQTWTARAAALLQGRLEEMLAACVLAVMVTIAFVNVITRYLIQLPLAFTEEITVNLFVWLVLLGTAAAFRDDAHLKVVFFVDRLPGPWRRWVIAFTHGVSLVVFLVILRLGWIQVADEIWLGMVTQSLGVPSWYFTLGMPVGALLVVVRILQALWRTLRPGPAAAAPAERSAVQEWTG
ncbi:MAG: TRAP transporter small permease [Limnochordales bacterium]|nr:TRAP transporter small permease [Limnochordales bacterium]